MRILLALFVLFSFCYVSNGQNEASVTSGIKSNMLSVGLEGAMTFPIGISYDQMVSNRFLSKWALAFWL